MTLFIWKSEVRAHELDVQGIVNNAHYFCYFDHARTLVIRDLGVDWAALSQDGFNLVLAKAEIEYKSSLKAFQTFQVETTIELEGKLKLIFNQRIFNDEKRLICIGKNTVVCVNQTTSKPIAIQAIEGLKIPT